MVAAAARLLGAAARGAEREVVGACVRAHCGSRALPSAPCPTIRRLVSAPFLHFLPLRVAAPAQPTNAPQAHAYGVKPVEGDDESLVARLGECALALVRRTERTADDIEVARAALGALGDACAQADTGLILSLFFF